MILVTFISGLASMLAWADPAGTEEDPLRVMLIPADGGTSDGTLSDFQPLFDGLTHITGLHFDIRTGQSYAAVVEGLCSGVTDIAWLGPVSFETAHQKGCAELLAVEVSNGASTYYAGLFSRRDSGIESLEDFPGHSLALGSIHSASSFAYPMAMLIEAGIDPLEELSDIRITGSHSNSLMALDSGHVDTAGASFVSFERALNSGAIEAANIRIVAKSAPIPNPPLAMHPSLADERKAQLRDALARIHMVDGINPAMIRGYGGKRVDSYDTDMTSSEFIEMLSGLKEIDDAFRGEVLSKSSGN